MTLVLIWNWHSSDKNEVGAIMREGNYDILKLLFYLFIFFLSKIHTRLKWGKWERVHQQTAKCDSWFPIFSNLSPSRTSSMSSIHRAGSLLCRLTASTRHQDSMHSVATLCKSSLGVVLKVKCDHTSGHYKISGHLSSGPVTAGISRASSSAVLLTGLCVLQNKCPV